MDQSRITSVASWLTAGSLLFLAAGTVSAQETDTGQGSSKIAVVQPVRITTTQSLEFGKITTNGTGVGRVTINARTGARTVNANVTRIGTTGFRRALFVVTGSPNRTVNMTTTGTTFTLNGPGPAMVVDQFRLSQNNAAQVTLPRPFVIPASGTMNVGFGARLTVANNQTPGIYSGTFNLIATYQ